MVVVVVTVFQRDQEKHVVDADNSQDQNSAYAENLRTKYILRLQ